MAEKVMTLSLGGKDRKLNFGKFWFQKFYGQATGSDPLNSTSLVLMPEMQFDFVVNIIYAGLRTQYKADKKQEDFTKEDVENWVGDKESDEIVILINDYTTLTTVKSGEAEAPEGA
jgi:hypothetical protein